MQQLQGGVIQQQPTNIIVVSNAPKDAVLRSSNQQQQQHQQQAAQQLLNVQSLNGHNVNANMNNRVSSSGTVNSQQEQALSQQDLQLLENLRNHQLFQQQKQHLQQQQINQLQRQINLMRVTRQHQAQSLNAVGSGISQLQAPTDDQHQLQLNQNLVQSLMQLQQQQVARRTGDGISHLQQRHSVPLNFDPNAVQIRVVNSDGTSTQSQPVRKQSAFPSHGSSVISQTPNQTRKEKKLPIGSVMPQKSQQTISAKDDKKKEVTAIPQVQKQKVGKKSDSAHQSSITKRQKSGEATASKDTAQKRELSSQHPRYNTEKKASKYNSQNTTGQNSAAKDASASPFLSMLDKAKDLESASVLNSRQNAAQINPGTSSINSNSQALKKKKTKTGAVKGSGASASAAEPSEKDSRKIAKNDKQGLLSVGQKTKAETSVASSAAKNRQAQSSANASIQGSAAHKTEAAMPPLAPHCHPGGQQNAPALTAKERRRLRIEAEKERERQLLEKNFKASSLYISKQNPATRTFITKPTAIIVYHDQRLVKLDINRSPAFQPSAVPQTSATPKPLILTPEELQDFYRTTVRLDRDAGRAMEVVEEPRDIFRQDQTTIDPKVHTIQERKIREVLDGQIKAKREAQMADNLAKNPIIFPSQNIKETTIFFNSRFESGNLREVEKLHEFEYNCYVNFDFNSTTHSQWYFFSVRNIGKGRQYKFNIMNLQKDESCYQIGMKPFVYSVKRNRENCTNQWRRACENVCYYKNKLRTRVRECAPDYEFDEDNIPCYEYEDEMSQMVTLNTLSFCYEFDYENDITFFAYFQPYTLSDLEDYLYQIPRKFDQSHLQNIYKCEKLCDTVGKRPCYVITITDNVEEDDINVEELVRDELYSKKGHSKDFNSGSMALSAGTGGQSGRGADDDAATEGQAMLSGYQLAAKQNREMDPNHHQKQTIFLSGRVHPGESNASFMIQGAIDFLLQNNNKEAKLLRETFIFKIVPMLNPDGVCEGHYRANYVGADLNRRWPNPSKLLHPTIYYTKKLLKMCHADNQVLLFCDFHGHTRKRNVFMYGCVSPQNEINQHKNNNLIRLVPYLLDQKNKLFSFNDCKFANEKEKESTGRLVMFKEFGILNSYTIESTFYSCYNPRMGQRKKVNVEDENQIKVEELIQIGKDFCETLTAIVNSKILKRKFILDTTNPLGAMIPGQGGNPLTQFLMNQSKAEANSSSANQQSNSTSGNKSFLTGVAQSSISQFSSTNAGATHHANQSSGTSGMWTDKKRIKRLQTEQHLVSSSTVPSVAPKAQSASKATAQGGPNTVQHSSQKVHQIANQTAGTPAPFNGVAKKIQMVRQGIKTKVSPPEPAQQTLVDPVLSQEEQASLAKSNNFPVIAHDQEVNTCRPTNSQINELMAANRVPQKKTNSFSLNQANVMMSPGIQQNVVPVQSFEQLVTQSQASGANAQLQLNNNTLQNYLNKIVSGQQQQQMNGAVFEQFAGQLGQPFNQQNMAMTQAMFKHRAVEPLKSEQTLADYSETQRSLGVLNAAAISGEDTNRKRQKDTSQIQPTSNLISKAQNFSMRRFEALLAANVDKSKMSKTQLMQRPVDMLGKPKPAMIDTVMLSEKGNQNELKLSLDGIHSPAQKIQQSMTPQINRSTAEKLRRESDGNHLGKVGSAILNSSNTPKKSMESKLETSQTQRKMIKTNDAFRRAAADSIHASNEMMPNLVCSPKQATIKDQNNFLQGLHNLVDQQNFFFGGATDNIKDMDSRLFRTSITSQANNMAGVAVGLNEPALKELLLSAGTSNVDPSNNPANTFESIKQNQLINSLNEGSTPFFHNVDSFDNMVRRDSNVQMPVIVTNNGSQQMSKMVDLPINQFPLDVLEAESLRKNNQKQQQKVVQDLTGMDLLFQKKNNKRDLHMQLKSDYQQQKNKDKDRIRKKDSSGSGSIDDHDDVLRDSPDLNLQDIELSSGIASSMTAAHLKAIKVAAVSERKKNILKTQTESEPASSEDDEIVKEVRASTSHLTKNCHSRHENKLYQASGIDSSGLRALEIDDSDEKSNDGSRAKNAIRRASSIDNSGIMNHVADMEANQISTKSKINYHALTDVKPSRLDAVSVANPMTGLATSNNSPDRIYYKQSTQAQNQMALNINNLLVPIDLKASQFELDFEKRKESEGSILPRDSFTQGVRGVSFGQFVKSNIPQGKQMMTTSQQEATAAAMLQQKMIISPEMASASITQNGNFFGLRQQKSKSSLSLMRNTQTNAKHIQKQFVKQNNGPQSQQRASEAAFNFNNSRPPTSNAQVDMQGVMAYQMLAEMMPNPIENFNPNDLLQEQQKKLGTTPINAMGKRTSGTGLYAKQFYPSDALSADHRQMFGVHEGPLDVYMNQNMSLPSSVKDVNSSQMRAADSVRTMVDRRPNSRTQQSQSGPRRGANLIEPSSAGKATTVISHPQRPIMSGGSLVRPTSTGNPQQSQSVNQQSRKKLQEQNQMLEMKQRVLKQRRNVAEQQIIQLQQNIIKARHSYQNTNGQDTSMTPQITSIKGSIMDPDVAGSVMVTGSGALDLQACGLAGITTMSSPPKMVNGQQVQNRGFSTAGQTQSNMKQQLAPLGNQNRGAGKQKQTDLSKKQNPSIN